MRPLPDCAGVALLLEPVATPRSIARISAWTTDTSATPWQHAPLEPLRASVPALRGLPMLERLARSQWGECVLDYLPGLQLAVRIEAA